MNLIEFLQNLSLDGWQLWLEGDRLRYRAPDCASTPSILDRLKQYKAEIIQILNDYPDLLSFYPLSYGQQALWFLWQLAPDSSAYNARFAAQIYSEIDIDAWRQVFQKFIERHPILRSSFTQIQGTPMQRVHQHQEIDFLQIDASNWSEETLNQKFIEFRQKSFNLERDRVLRVRLFSRSLDRHILLIVIHHIACDGWSFDLLLNELPKLYNAQINQIETFLPPLPQFYRDYVRWQRNAIGENQHWEYWQQKLAGELHVLNLPSDRQRPPIQTYNGASYNFRLSEELTTNLKALAQQEGTTIYTLLLAAFQILLYRYTHQEDILVGSPTSGRNKPEFSDIFGYFVNPVVLRANLSGEPSFKSFLSQVRQTVLEALAHQDYPFPLLVERLQPQRDPSRSPIFQVFFVFQKLQQASEIQQLFLEKNESFINWGGLKMMPFAITQPEGQFDLTLEIADSGTSLVGSWIYNTDLFDATTIARMIGHFQTLLTAIVQTPEETVDRLPLLTTSELDRLLLDWNNTLENYPLLCIHQWFERQVEKTPDAIAVVFKQQQLTYHQLNQRANQLAHYLQNLGVKPDSLVGLCAERSLEMVVGVLGILKAGGAYVPLDPAYPPERLKFMLKDTQVSILLAQKHLQSLLSCHSETTLYLDSQWDLIARESDFNLETEVKPEHLLYVIYTSGSTGIPKGIMLSHAALTNLIQWHLQTMVNAVRVLQFASLSFDASFHEMFAAWCSGGTLYLISETDRFDLGKLVNFLAENSIQKAIFPVAVLQQLAEAYGEHPQLFASLTEAIATGEQLQITQPVIELFSCLKNCTLHNHYGPSETHVVTSYIFNEPPQAWRTYPPIGKPIANTQIYILDRYLQPVPIGVWGFLYIGGISLARGYLHREDLTAEKFIPNPFKTENHSSNFSDILGIENSKLYKTGDLARYLPDGNIEFLGRVDDQVKVRGFRVEIGEIEAVLNQHPQLTQSVVIVQGTQAVEKRLIAYIVKVREQPLTEEILRDFLKQKLPDYMIPSAFIFLDSLPLTPNGKVNKRALPDLGKILDFKALWVPPRTPAEEVVTQIWQEVLHLDRVGIQDNFFELGGHSLLAMQLVSRIQQQFDLDLSVRQVFQNQTVAELVEMMAQIVGDREIIEEIARTWQEINEMSPEQVQLMLEQNF